VSPTRTLADELAACRRTARDCDLVLAHLAGAQIAPHEVAEARLLAASLSEPRPRLSLLLPDGLVQPSHRVLA
jgi:hypothetical protein